MKGKTSNFFMFILMGLLILGLAGFGVSSFGGSASSVAKVGSINITVDEYARALQQELRAASAQSGETVTMAQARSLGLDRVVLARLVATASLDNETARLGVSVGDERVLDEIVAIPSFQGLDGNFDREAYEFALEQNNLTASQFEENVRRDTARTLLQAAALGGIVAPPAYIESVATYAGERRSFDWATLTPLNSEITVGTPNDADLTAYYEANPERYTLPEMRVFTTAHLAPEMMLDAIEVSDGDLQAAYDARKDEFIQPERRLVERLVFGDTGQAQAARDRIDSGEATFEDIVAERELTLQDIDLGDVRANDLTNEASAAVFATAGPGIVGPANSGLGPALFRVNGILNAVETTLDEVREELTAGIALDAARRAVSAEIETLDDLLAGGATLEDLATESAVELATLRLTPGSEEGLAAYPEVRAAAVVIEEGDFPELTTLEDGGVFALRLDEVVAPKLQPLDEVRDDVAADWRAAETQKALDAAGEKVVERLNAGDSFEDIGLTPTRETDVTRRAFLEILPSGLVSQVFTLKEGGATSVSGDQSVAVARLVSVQPPDENDPDLAALRNALEQTVAQGISQDLFAAFADALQAEAGLSIEQSMINAVQTQFP